MGLLVGAHDAAGGAEHDRLVVEATRADRKRDADDERGVEAPRDAGEQRGDR
jgi:hypothetical protein